MSHGRVWATSDDGSIEYVSISKELLEPAIEAMQKSFYVHENVCVAFDVPNQPESFSELDGLFRRTASDGVSIAAVDKATGIVAGAAFNKLEEPEQSSFLDEYAKCLKYSASKGVAMWMADLERRFDIFEHCQVNSLMEIMFLGIIPEFRKRGIAKKLMEVSIDLGRTLKNGQNVKVPIDDKELDIGNPPQVVLGIFTSLITQKIAKDLNFKFGTKVDFDEFVYGNISLGSVIDRQTPYLTYEYIEL